MRGIEVFDLAAVTDVVLLVVPVVVVEVAVGKFAVCDLLMRIIPFLGVDNVTFLTLSSLSFSCFCLISC